MNEKELDLGPIEGRLQLECTENVGSWGLTTEYQSFVIEDMTALIAEVKRLRGDGLFEYYWSDGGQYIGGCNVTIVAKSLEDARKIAKEDITDENQTGGWDMVKLILNEEPGDVSRFIPPTEGNVHIQIDNGG